MPPASRSRTWVGIPLALAAAVSFALANTSARLALVGGSNPQTLAAIRFVLPTIVLVVWLRQRDIPLRLPPRDRWIAIVLGVVNAVQSWALLTSISEIPLALAVLIFYLFPLNAAVIVGICGWEKLGWHIVAAIVLAFVGLALALDPGGDTLEIEGVALAFLASLALAVVVAVSSRVFRAGDPRPVTLHMTAVASVLLITFCAARGTFVLPHTSLGWIGITGVAGFYAFSIITFYIAVSMVGPVHVSLLCYAEPVVTAGFGVFLLGEILSPIQIIGVALVIVALISATLGRLRVK